MDQSPTVKLGKLHAMLSFSDCLNFFFIVSLQTQLYVANAPCSLILLHLEVVTEELFNKIDNRHDTI